MTNTEDSDESVSDAVYDRWQSEQRAWQRLVIEYIDRATTSEDFLTNLGNAMRGSLLTNKPYPGTSTGSESATRPSERRDLDELVFALRRVEGQVLELTMVVEKLVGRSQLPPGADVDGPTAANVGTE